MCHVCAIVLSCYSFCEWIVKRWGQSERERECRTGCVMMSGRALRTGSPSVTGQLQKWMNLPLALWLPAQHSSSNDVALNHLTLYKRDSNLLLFTKLTAVDSLLILLYLLPLHLVQWITVYIYNFFFSISSFEVYHQTAHPSRNGSSINVPAKTRFLKLYLISALINSKPK